MFDRIANFHRDCGKTVIRLNRFVPAYVINRLQKCQMWEAFYLIENGYCTAQDIDMAVKASLMPRGLLMGIMHKMDFSGLDMAVRGLEEKTYQAAPHPGQPKSLMDHYNNGELGVKTGKGYYSYTKKSRLQILREADKRLIKSINLVKEFDSDPLYDV